MSGEGRGSLTNTERRRVVPAAHGSGHAGDVGVALEGSGTGVGSLPPWEQLYVQPRAGGLFRGLVLSNRIHKDTRTLCGVG